MEKMPSSLRQYARLIGSCWRFSGGQRHRMVAIYILFLLANICFMFQPWLIGELVNALQAGGDGLLGQTVFWLGLYVGSMFMFWVFHGPSRVIERKLAFYIRRNFNVHYYETVTRLPVRWHQDHHSGNTINRINKASQALFDFAGKQFLFFETFVRAAFVFIALAFVDWHVSLALFTFTVGMFFILNRFDRVIMKKIHAVNEGEHVFSSYKFDFISNIYSVIAFNLAAKTGDHLKNRLQDFFRPYREQIVLNECKWFIMMNLIVISHFSVLLFYIWYHLQPGQALLLGTLVAIFQYMQRLDTVFYRVAELYLQLVQHFTDLNATAPIDGSFAVEGVTDDDKPDLAVRGGAVSFRNLSFSYNGRDQVFGDLSLDIPAGQKVGLIGPSGAGKTSLVNVLLRFNPVQRLDISIDGQNIYDVNAPSLRRAVALIPQDTSLFQDTLRENIRYGRLDASDSEVEEAARKAYAHEFITALPDGYETLVGERGIKLSGGQRQRIAIARAILKDAPILILDEATSALDSESEKHIQDSLRELMRGKTVIAIAHRLSTIAHLDRLIVMEGGRIIEDGTHAGLLAQGGLYAKLWNMQSGGFIGADRETA